ncbi:S8 family serine peptidase [Streptomyces omiyaensis]|uniref:alpha-amylase n=1 Tax=Streptomyces omiyaensis TaxID=68247 RepID=A0ABW7BRK4_9ACTN
MSRGRSLRRGLVPAVLAALLGVPLMGAAPPSGHDSVPAASALERKARGGVLAEFADGAGTRFWVQLASEADTSAPRGQVSGSGTSATERRAAKTARGRAVIAARQGHADRAQAGLRALLDQEGAAYRSFWISNTMLVTGGEALAARIAARDEVTAILADDPIAVPDPLPAVQEAAVDGVEWNVERVGAPRVWDELGVRGEGTVVAGIDTGVDHDHPALLGSYRGLASDGTVDHAYNWFDPTGVCAERGPEPCDEGGHGTHTMGTMVGDDGAGNRIGVAPGATWIAAKACNPQECTRSALLAAGQWMLAPTDAKGRNPRPDLAPDVVNNSWGSKTLDTWYRDMVQAWRDAGIFPAFSGGNLGPACDVAGAPGAYAPSYATGAFDVAGRIAPFSSRGPGENGTVKPDIAAPGVNVRSAAPGGGYVPNSGTSMASPHTAATVALLWSAAPALRGDVAATEAVLGGSAIDVDATACGGTAQKNNVFGEGRLDAYAAVTAAPRGALGALTGTVTTAAGTPVGDATVSLTGPVRATARTRSDGTFTLPRVVAGTYPVTVVKFGYLTGKSDVTVVADRTTTTDTVLVPAPTGTVTGTVGSVSGPEADVELVVQGTPVRTTTGADGRYALTLPTGTYEVTITPRNKCAETEAIGVTVGTGGLGRNVSLSGRVDGFGTTCRQSAAPFPSGDSRVDVTGPYGGYDVVDLPFPVALYGRTYDKAWVSLDGVLILGSPDFGGANTRLPDKTGANGALYPFWDDLRMDEASGIYTAVRGTAPHREFVVEWRDMQLSKTPDRRVGFAAAIGEDGTYSFHYRGVDPGGVNDELGAGATVGAENHEGTDAFLYSFKEVSLREGMAVRFRPERSAVVSGTVLDANDGKPVPGAKVTVTRDGTAVATPALRADGSYLAQVPATDPAPYEVRVTAPNYEPVTETATLQGLSVLRTGTRLRTGVVVADRTEGWALTIPAGETRERSLVLANSGSAADYTVREKAGAPWLTATPSAGRIDASGTQRVTLTFDTSRATPGTVLKGTLVVASASGRAPVTELPLTVVVPAYRSAVDAGATSGLVDGQGDAWTADRAWAEGSYGYLGEDAVAVRTNKSIGNTQEQELLRTGRQAATGYRFDGLPNGVYQVELGFAELSGKAPGRRVFDVLAEGVEKLSNVDVALESGGGYRALTKSFTVTVTDGRLDLTLSAVTGTPLVNTVRVTHRPDLR